jgi:hypothetical protein
MHIVFGLGEDRSQVLVDVSYNIHGKYQDIIDQILDTVRVARQSAQTISKPNVPVEDGVACTMEAKLCPDGSYVGRSGPKCEFAPCPGN